MYIRKVHIENIKCFDILDISFDEPAGWHVFIGDNGSGKSSLLKAIALGIIGSEASQGLRLVFNDWITKNQNSGHIKVEICRHHDDNGTSLGSRGLNLSDCTNLFTREFKIENYSGTSGTSGSAGYAGKIIRENPGWFSASFGPYRRFSGGTEKSNIYESNPELAAHLSVFGEDIAFTGIIEWLQKLHYKSLEKHETDGWIFNKLKSFINVGGLLPHGIQLTEVNSEGVFFRDGNACTVGINDLCDGYRSILSLTFELLRIMIHCYGAQKTFKEFDRDNFIIDLPGVVLIDEVDAHLHPSWQAIIGDWFLKFFPKIQFIVTTHSPLVCRASKTGSIWRLSVPGSQQGIELIEGTERDRLIWGNVLDAFGTNNFGSGVSISSESNVMLNRLAILNSRSISGKITNDESKELLILKNRFPTTLINDIPKH